MMNKALRRGSIATLFRQTTAAALVASLTGPLAVDSVVTAQAPRSQESGWLVSPPPPAGQMVLFHERIPLEGGGLAKAERGVIFVPLNRARPGSAVISLEVYRFPAAQPQPGALPIFLLFGGPNFGGLEPLLATRGFYERRIRPLLDAGDLVVVSQRGIGPSKPTTLIEPPKPFPIDRPFSEAERVEAIRSASQRGKAFWMAQGLDLEGYTVEQAAADIDDVRRALGYKRIVLWGGSFGSHWAIAVMRFFPAIVERAILRGLEGPDHTYDMPSHVLNALRRIASEADASPALAPHIPPGGLLAAFQTVIDRTAREPVVVSVTDPATGAQVKVRFEADDVRRMALGYSASASNRRGLRTWPADVLALYRGDWTAAARSRLEEQQAPAFRTASYYVLDCSSGISPARRSEMAADMAAATVGELGANYRAACPVWNVDAGDAFRRNFETNIPTVLVHGDFDVSTPLENAVELAPFFRKGKLIVVHGGTHPALDDAMDHSSEFAQAIIRFARNGDMSALPASVRLPRVDFVVPSSPAR